MAVLISSIGGLSIISIFVPISSGTGSKTPCNACDIQSMEAPFVIITPLDEMNNTSESICVIDLEFRHTSLCIGEMVE